MNVPAPRSAWYPRKVNVATVTTTDQSLLTGVRSTLHDADEALLCVAFVQERGVRLLEKELKSIAGRGGRARLVVTTTFQTTTAPALRMLRDGGVDVRVLNPGGGTSYHPKLYLGRHGQRTQAVIASANLTGGLWSNLEAGVWLDGVRDDKPLADAWSWAERVWEDRRGFEWGSELVLAAEGEEELEPELLAALAAAVRVDPMFRSVSKGKPNRVTELTPSVVYVETERSRERRGRAEPIPAWMFNLAWNRLLTHGELSNVTLLSALRVHRSSAVCAILARLPQVEVVPGRHVVLRWRGANR
jgi:HKD family nuclease